MFSARFSLFFIRAKIHTKNARKNLHVSRSESILKEALASFFVAETAPSSSPSANTGRIATSLSSLCVEGRDPACVLI